MPDSNSLEQLHLHFIRAAPDNVWEALTTPEATRLYFHGLAVESEFLPGCPIRYLSESDEGGAVTVIEGEVREVEEARRLVHTFSFVDGEDAPTRVEYEIEGLGNGVTRLSVIHDGFEGETSTYVTTRTGWAPIFSGMKTLLETGEPLAIPSPEGTGSAH